MATTNAETQRLADTYSDGSTRNWLQWGPYLSERQWGTVREDYSAGGTAWDYLPHDHARSRAYRWGEDGLGGLSDSDQKLCFSLALWNGNDPILKERLFGLTNSEGNHGEDVKEYYYYLDNTPTHSYMKYLYKYPQAAYPYSDLVNINRDRKSNGLNSEYELIDTNIFQNDRYYDVQVEYAKADVNDILIKISVTNHGSEKASLHVLPTLLFRNTWSWFENAPVPTLETLRFNKADFSLIRATRQEAGATIDMGLYCEGAQDLLFVDNETNSARLFGSANSSPYPKDGINDYLIKGSETIRPEKTGTKASALYHLEIEAGATQEIRLRFSSDTALSAPFGDEFEQTVLQRRSETDVFYEGIANENATEEQKMIQRQAYSGMLWSKQFFYYVVQEWLEGDPVGPPPPASRLTGRNKDWKHFYASDVLAMPDKWEYPWFATWDLCFHTVVYGRLDLEFAKQQLLTLAHEWYMSPQGAIPAYEWSFSDVNPPLHAWAALQLHNMEVESRRKAGDTDFEGDFSFLSDIFHHCLMNFTWWSNKEDPNGTNLFEGGFLGLDNISIINRSDLVDFSVSIGAESVVLSQSDGTSWVGMFCLNMIQLAQVLTKLDAKTCIRNYTHHVNKFFQYFVMVSDAMNGRPHPTDPARYLIELWDENDNFFYDFLTVNRRDGGQDYYSIKLRTLTGVIALFPVAIINLDKLKIEGSIDGFKERFYWFLESDEEHIRDVIHVKEDLNTKDITDRSNFDADNLFDEPSILLSFIGPQRLKLILERVLSEAEFLSPYGIRGLSKVYADPNRYNLTVEGTGLSINYEPAESTDGSFGGNSNWRGPVWFPVNFMLIEKLMIYYNFYGDAFKVEYPTGSGQELNLQEVAQKLSLSLISIFEQNPANKNHRPVFGGNPTFQENPAWHNSLFFYEYFHGDNGAGLGASHQTGWTGLVAELIDQVTKPNN